MEHKIKLQAKEEVAKDTYSFIFDKPEGFEFVPGQFVEMDLGAGVNSENPRDRKHYFSVASPKRENNLKFITRIRDSVFKQALYNLQTGDEVSIGDAMGKFTIEDKTDVKDFTFLVGGIGITPILSIIESLEDAEQEEAVVDGYSEVKATKNILIIYSNTNMQLTPLYERLYQKYGKIAFRAGEWQIKFGFTMTQEEVQGALNGRISWATIEYFWKDFLGEKPKGQFGIVGTKDFVGAMKGVLKDEKVDSKRIMLDLFEGY